MHTMQSRRDFLTTLSAAGTAGVLGARGSLADDGPPEIATARLLRDVTCGAPIAIAEDLVRAEGFAEVRYAEFEPGLSDVQHVLNGSADIVAAFAPDIVSELDNGTPITVLAGLHVGCQELFARESINSIKDLKGKRVALNMINYGPHLTLSVMAAAVGLDPTREIEWIVPPSSSSITPGARELFEAGKVDAYLALPPHAQELRASGHGHVILRTSTDRPWSQYFCCMLVARREHAERNPAATKRLMRAILKSTDVCATEPQQAARKLAERAPEIGYDMALAIMADVPYNAWREYDHEDTLRFFALRLHELEFIKSSPKQLIAQGTDWRFLNEIKRELKA